MKRLLMMLAMLGLAIWAVAVPQEWSVDVSRVQPSQFNAYHGETLELKASFFLRGQPYSVAGEDFSLIWQTNGMGSAYWTAPATAASNTVSAVFTGAMDPGAPLVYGFLGSTGSNYRASFAIRFASSPGAVANELPLPQQTIDFSKVGVVNAPWVTEGDIEDALTNYYTKAETDAAIAAIDIPAPPVTSVNSQTGAVVLTASDVGALPTTGGTMTGALTMDKSVIELKDASGYKNVLRCTGTGGDFYIDCYNAQGTLVSSISLRSIDGIVAFLSDVYAVVSQIAPAWVSGSSYAANVLVSYNGVVYQNTSGTTIQSATSPNSFGSGWTAKNVADLFLPLTGGTVNGNITATQGFDLGYGLGHGHIDSGGIDLDYDSGQYTHRLSYPHASGTIALLSDIPTIYAWAKASTKPSYSLNEICPNSENWLGVQGDAGRHIKVLAGTVGGQIVGGLRVTASTQNDNNMTTYTYGGVAVRRNGANTDYLWDQSANGIARLSDIPTVPTWTATNTSAVISYNYGKETVAIPSGGTLTANLTGWNDGEQIFVVLQPAGSYSVASNIKYCGYGTWPTNTALCVAWPYSQTLYINPIILMTE